MIFIADPKKASSKDKLLLHALPTLIVFIAFLGVTIWSWQTTKQRVVSQKEQVANQEIDRIESRIKDRMDDYQQILESADGLYQASAEVNREEWKAFYDNYDVSSQYPGLQGIAFAERVPRAELEAHQNKLRSEGFSDYTVTPPGERPVYVPIIFPITTVSPDNYQSLNGFGFDIASEPARNLALEAANRTGESALTGKLVLLAPNREETPACILYHPVYRKGSKTDVAGYAYAPFTAENLFEGIFGDRGSKAAVGFKVYDQKVSEANKLYQNQLFAEAGGTVTQHSIKVAGRDWVVEYKVPDSIVSAANRRNPTATLIAGIIFSTLIAGLVLSLLLARTRTTAIAENQALQRAKDDLLSIASHQLRTPATGVKQYIGMLLEGYSGKLTATQTKLLKEAYNSNERQLGIIDEILHVARIDTGRLILQEERLKIRDIIDSILREQNKVIRDRSQRILTSFPKKVVYAYGDPQYVRMAIENIVNNAIKYTPEKGTITLKIQRRGDFVAVVVSDTGVGIKKEDLDLLFQKFSRIPNELSRQAAGSGVGLYIAKQLVEMHGGSIGVDSQQGKGTTFTILLPLAKPRLVRKERSQE